ncbi:hypothetical protein PIB30_053155 [Stylosanthes scabra]|uniref:Polyprotein n=1 Tax=Stylosanthes scabra TaxID=79078 RepID=A0ABU6SIN0_9FABA|nr:hypothetical protein [Stylosanthes scabra]
MAKIALLDTTFKEYQNALIGALVTTLTNGSVILTISPDFIMRLTDPTLSQRIKIQVQLIGAIQDSAAEQATLHHQVLYRVQDHALDLKLPNSTGDALLMFHDKNHGPAIVNIPRMITTEELSSIVPLEWITNYEKAFPQQIPDVHTIAPPRITRASDGTITTVFQRPGFEGQSSFRQSSFRRICTISPISIQHTAHLDDPPVHYYDNGKPVYVSHIQGHFIWDVDPSMCDSDCDCQNWNDWSDSEDEDYERRRRKSKKKKKQSCTVSKRPDPPDEPDYKPKFSLKRCSRKSYQDYSTANPQVVPCIATLESYDHDFPPLQTSVDDARVTRRPYVTPPQGVSPHGYQAIIPQEEVLNWHTDNALNQNKELRDRLATQAIQLDHDLKTYIHEQYFGPDFYKKNQELIKIKAQLKQIEDDQARKTRPQTLTIDPLSLYPPPYPTYTPNLYPLPSSPPQSSDYGSIFQPRPPWKLEFREFFLGDSSGTNKGEKEEKASDRTINFMAQNDSTSEEDSSADYSEETSEEDHIADVSAIAMVNPAGEDSDEGHVTDDEDHRQPRQTTPSLPPPDSSSSKSGNFYFTFDDIDPDKYRQRLNDFGAWIDTRMTIPGMTLPQVHTEFITRMTGNLREWMNGFSEYERMGLVNGTSENFLGLIHKGFLGDITIIQKRNSQEYYEMKCCSLNRRHLKIHYKRMINKYYSLGEYVQEITEAFPEAQRCLQQVLSADQVKTRIHVIAVTRRSITSENQVNPSNLSLISLDERKEEGDTSRGEVSGAKRPTNAFSAAKLDDDDFEDILEEQSQKDADTQYVLHMSDSDTCSDRTDDEDEPRPHFNLKVKASKYDRPVKAVAFLDTGSCATIVKPHMLPSEVWIPFNKKFTTINQEVFTISLISKENVGLQLFPEVTTWIRVLGSDLLDKNVLFGYDAYYRTKGVSIWPDGLKYKKQFLSFSNPMSISE